MFPWPTHMQGRFTDVDWSGTYRIAVHSFGVESLESGDSLELKKTMASV